MKADLLERTRSSDALSHFQWQSPRLGTQYGSKFTANPDITSQSCAARITFGSVHILLEESPPSWSYDVLAGISALGNLGTGWDSYGALPVNPFCAVSAISFVLRMFNHRTPEPAVVPTSRGGIQFEWHCRGADLEIEVESPDVFHVYFADERTGEECEITFSDNLVPLKPLLNRISSSD